HQAEIDVEAAKAAAHERAFGAAVERRIQTAEEVDRCLAALRTAFREFDDAGFSLTIARQSAGSHNHGLDAIAGHNPVLAERARNVWPKARVMPDGVVQGYVVKLPTDANANSKPLSKEASLATTERNMWRIPARQLETVAA